MDLGSTLYMYMDIDNRFKMLAKIDIIGLGNAIKKERHGYTNNSAKTVFENKSIPCGKYIIL